jgi:Xaa-Pro aminopeptidase
MKPGVNTNDLLSCVNEVFVRNGYPRRTSAFGHELGIFAHEGRIQVGSSVNTPNLDPILHKNMVFTLEPAIITSHGRLCQEEVVVVTNDGGRLSILFVGESCIATLTEYKGLDQFSETNYNESAEIMRRLFMELGHNFTHIPCHMVSRKYPKTIEDLHQYDVILFSDVGSNTFLLNSKNIYYSLHVMIQKNRPHVYVFCIYTIGNKCCL